MKLTRYELIPAGLMALAILIMSAVMWTPKAHAQTCYVGGAVTGQITRVSGTTIETNGGAGFDAMLGCGINIGAMDIGGRVLYGFNSGSFASGTWQAAGVLGWRLNEHVRPYIVAGFAGLDDDLHYRGYVVGPGIDLTLSKNLFGFVEYNGLWMDPKNNKKPEEHRVRIGVKVNLF